VVFARLAGAVIGATVLSTLAVVAITALVDESEDQTASATRFGTSIQRQPGESSHDAFARAQQAYGRHGAVRVFYAGLPATWATISDDYGSTPLVVSFKAPPEEVTAGRFDDRLRRWFADAPTDRITWWSYYHEPENEIAAGAMSAEAYRRAWTHLAGLAESADNPNLKATLILMNWTVNPASGRAWRNYYPGDAIIDVLAWDAYNPSAVRGVYRSPEHMFGRVRAVSRAVGKPWGVAEFGSVIAAGDDGNGRAAWLRATAQYLRDEQASFATYFDTDIGVDYRLSDAPSRAAWREIVASQPG